MSPSFAFSENYCKLSKLSIIVKLDRMFRKNYYQERL
jgi:hypothetical protein